MTVDKEDILEYFRSKKKKHSKIRKGRKEDTLNRYFSNLKSFLDFYSEDISELKTTNVNDYKKYLKEKKYSDSTINVKLTALAQYIKYLNNSKGYKIYNVRIEKIDIPKKEYLEKVITRDQFALIQEKCRRSRDIRSLAIFNTLFYTGCRVSELERITVGSIQSEKCNIKGKGDINRYIYLSNNLLKRTLNAYLKARYNTSISLFTGQNGALSTRRIQQLWSHYCKEANVEGLGIHTLRHLYALEYMKVNDGENAIFELQKRLGHKHLDTTFIYLVKKEGAIKDQVNKIK